MCIMFLYVISFCGRFLPSCLLCLLFFFFKQKTAYEIRLSLVGSEMCIRDRTRVVSAQVRRLSQNASNAAGALSSAGSRVHGTRASSATSGCLLYTSDAAD